MSSPYYTIAIPTKNRPDRLADTIKSVNHQTFNDLEIIVCDNSDDAQAVRTEQVVRAFADPRIRYVRTSGQLSMPDNWERSIADARGEYVGILTDRSVYRRNALQVVHSEIEKTGAKVVSWFQDQYGRDPRGTTFRRRECTHRRHRLKSKDILGYFLNGHPKYSSKIVPKLMTCVCHRSVLDAIRSSSVGRCCPPVCPDYTSGFLMLAHSDWALMLDEALFVSCGLGNGFEFRMRGELADRFLRDLGMSWSELVDYMPSEACFTHGLILNDLMRLREALPHGFQSAALNHVQYYLGCMSDYVKASRRGLDRREDLQLLLEALDREAEGVQQQVKARRMYVKAVNAETAPAKDSKEIDEGPDGTNVRRFDTVFDALAWDEANPQKPVSSTFLDVLPGLEEDSKKPRRPAVAVLTRLVKAALPG